MKKKCDKLTAFEADALFAEFEKQPHWIEWMMRKLNLKYLKQPTDPDSVRTLSLCLSEAL